MSLPFTRGSHRPVATSFIGGGTRFSLYHAVFPTWRNTNPTAHSTEPRTQAGIRRVLSRRLSCLRINRCLKAIRRPGRSWRRMIRNRRSVKSPPPNVSPPFLRGAAFYLRCTCSVRRTVRFSPLFHASVSLDPQTCDAQVGGARN